jgi:transposase InsO family protein
MLNVLDEFTHECLAIRVARKLKAIDVIDVLSDLFILRGVPAHIRSDNGPEFVAKAVQEWIAAVGAKTAYIERGSPWENGYIESFNARLRDELLNGEISYTLREAQIVIESWRRQLRQQYYERTRDAPSPAALNAALNVLETQAQFDSPQHKVWLRLAEQDGLIYLDLADEWMSAGVASKSAPMDGGSPRTLRSDSGAAPACSPFRSRCGAEQLSLSRRF